MALNAHVRRRRIKNISYVKDLRLLEVLRTENFESFAVGSLLCIVEITEH